MGGKIIKVCLDRINFDKVFNSLDIYTTDYGLTFHNLFKFEIPIDIIQ